MLCNINVYMMTDIINMYICKYIYMYNQRKLGLSKLPSYG